MSMNKINIVIIVIGLFSSMSFAENLYQAYYGKYKITDIHCTFNDEVQETCLKWKQVEFKSDPVSKEYMCVLMKSANGTSSDCYTEENIITDNSRRIAVYRQIPGGVQFERFIRINTIERKYIMNLIKTDSGFIFTRNDQNHFPESGQNANGFIEMKLVKIRSK